LSEVISTRLNLVEGYEFKVNFDVEGVRELIVDETKPVGENLGPNARRLLSAAIGQCLSTSLLFCLRKNKITVKDLETNVKLTTHRNKEGYLRIKSLDVQICLGVSESDRSQVDRCLEVFKKYSIVTQSVLKGIKVNIAVNNE
jgi:uncharacterized OsmC-like protein